MKNKYYYLVEKNVISKDDLDFFSEAQFEKLAKVYERVKKLKKGKTCVWFWRKNFDWWTFYILFREDIFEKLDIENVKRIFELSLRKIRKIKFLNSHDVFTYSLEAPGNEIKELDRFSTLRMEFNNLILLEIEGDPLKISRKIQSIMTKIFSKSESEDLSQQDRSSEDGALDPSSSPCENEAKDIEATSQSLEPSSEDSDQITPDKEDSSGSTPGECSSSQEENSSQTTSQDQKEKDLDGSSGSFKKYSSSQEDASIQDEPSRVSGPSEVTSTRNGDGSGEAEDGSGESGTPTVVPESSSEDSEEDKKPSPEVECQSEASGFDTGAGSLASVASLEEDNLFQGEQGKERAGESDELLLDSCPAGALSEQEESCNEKTGQDSSTSSEESGSLWELKFNSEENQHSYGGGGGQAKALSAKDSNSKVEKQVTLLLQKLFASIEDTFKKQEGRDFWDAKKVICSSAFAPQNLPISKFSRPSFRKISLWVDVSGSVDYLTNFIISMIVSASKDKDVQVVIGSEAHPEKILPKNFHKLNKDWWEVKAVWEHEYIKEFEDQIEVFLRKNKLEQGSLIVIWSDYFDIHAEDLSKLARLLKPYRVVWLCSHDQKKDADYEGNESFKLEKFARKQGHLFLWEIDSPEGIRKAVKCLNVKKCLSS